MTIDSKFALASHPSFRVSGGMGDTLICCGVVSNLPCKKTVFVRKHLVPLMRHMKWLEDVQPITAANNFRGVKNYTSSHNFDDCFANWSFLTSKEYYTAAMNHIGLTDTDFKHGVIGQFDFPCKRRTYDWAIHTGASNPNRQWTKKNWFDLAVSLSAAGQSVCFLGTKSEWGFTDEAANIKKLSDDTDDIVSQTETLSGCRHFIGNDSGFCHLAGILGLDGHVLFFNTHPEQVIARYPSLKAIHQFDSIGEPSRALSPHDKQSCEAISNMTLDFVCERLGLDSKESAVFTNLLEITIIGNSQKSLLFRNNLTETFSLVPNSEIKILPDYNLVEVNGKTFSFFGGPYDLQRFLRDLGVA